MNASSTHAPLNVVLGVGSNLGGRVSLVRAATSLLRNEPEISLQSVSSLYQTTPIGPPQPQYINAAIRLQTRLSPHALLDRCLHIEKTLGRVRTSATRWHARTMDLDVLHIHDTFVDTADLVVPHPRLHERAFAMLPLLEVAPDAADPHTGQKYASPTSTNDVLVLSPWSESFPTTYLEHTADEGFEVTALDRADVLAAAAEAMMRIVVEPESVRATTAIEVDVELPTADDERLFGWLSEVLYITDSQRFAIRSIAVTHDGEERVRGVLLGEPIDETRHAIGGAIKAVTYHEMHIGPLASTHGWSARVVIDV